MFCLTLITAALVSSSNATAERGFSIATSHSANIQARVFSPIVVRKLSGTNTSVMADGGKAEVHEDRDLECDNVYAFITS